MARSRRRMGAAAAGPGTRIKGVRFQLLVSPSRRIVDISDLKHSGSLVLLDVAAVLELRELADRLLQDMEGG